ncbi:hypothetical protein GCK72_012258 [Caenorhabditis remanei]|uniref:Uncharacterized protein n=1 Tax=Caenorhabditis remanei TaxID=31234 RepID=A0A6A5GKH5_CAERE|nr:hypothetical protein GCK72_012258 [Caenorhabditis remanei]KAF1755808.1 hypothetical protein GCK72_012258 [Caenorhabditis remanei]
MDLLVYSWNTRRLITQFPGPDATMKEISAAVFMSSVTFSVLDGLDGFQHIRVTIPAFNLCFMETIIGINFEEKITQETNTHIFRLWNCPILSDTKNIWLENDPRVLEFFYKMSRGEIGLPRQL